MSTRNTIVLVVVTFTLVVLCLYLNVYEDLAVYSRIAKDRASPQMHVKPNRTSNKRMLREKVGDQEWLKAYSFIPNYLQHCQDLFKGVNRTYPPDINAELRLHKAELVKYQITEGHVGFYPEEVLTYLQLVSAPFVKTVCETGFNAGHSTLIWLASKPDTRVYSFDIGEHRYSKPISKYLQARFPDRLTLTWGDSTKTLPIFRRNNTEVLCDLIVIDGGHTTAAAKSDFNNFKTMASCDNIVVFDNYPDTRYNFIKLLGDMWESKKKTGELAEVFRCNYGPKIGQGFSAGKMITKKCWKS